MSADSQTDSQTEVLKLFPEFTISRNPITVRNKNGLKIIPTMKNSYLHYNIGGERISVKKIVASQYLEYEEGDKIEFKKSARNSRDIKLFEPENLVIIKSPDNTSNNDGNDDDESQKLKITWSDVDDCKIDVRKEENITDFINSCPFKLETRNDYIDVICSLRYFFASVHSTPKLFIIKDKVKNGFKISYTNKEKAKEKLEEISVGKVEGKVKTAWDIYKQFHELFTYDYITFYECNNTRAFNFFNGYYHKLVDFKKEVIELFLKHVKEVICNGNGDHADYLHKVFATLIRNPDEKLNIALCVLGKERTGKQTFFTDVWCNVLKGYSVKNGDMQHVTGDYNSSIEGKRVYVVNETDDANLSKHLNSNRLKKLVSDPTFACREMYQKVRDDADNRAFFIFLSNNMFPLKISNEDERYFVLKVSDKHRNDIEYFEKLSDSINEKEFYDHLYTYYAQVIDLTGFKYRKIPMTEAKKFIQQASGDSVQDYFINCYLKVVNNTLDEIYEGYCTWCEKTRRKPFGQNSFQAIMEEEYTGKKKQVTINKNRLYVYNIKPEKLKDLIDLNPTAFEDQETREAKESDSKEIVDIVCGINDPNDDQYI